MRMTSLKNSVKIFNEELDIDGKGGNKSIYGRAILNPSAFNNHMLA